MANREALRELQTRLADRLQAARTEGVQASWLAVEAAGVRYLFPLAQAGEIFPFAQPQHVPYTQPWFLGVANLRGGLYGVVDLAAFASGRPPALRTEAGRADSRLVALNAGARPLVDAGSEDKLEIIVQEILQDKIFLDTSNEMKTVGESGPTSAGPPEFDFSSL